MNDPFNSAGRFTIISQAAQGRRAYNFWERSCAPTNLTETPLLDARLRDMLESDLPAIMQAPFQCKEKTSAAQLDCAARLVRYASEIPVYREKYRRAGIAPGGINSWEEFRKLPLMTKPELQAAYPEGCVHSSVKRDTCFQTRSSGSSGVSLRIMVDLEAIATDTLQGVRQYSLQTGLQYRSSDAVANIYTVPWWTNAIGGCYINHFISSLISPAATVDILNELQPEIISLYPSNLDALMPHRKRWTRDRLSLIVTHSEQSTRDTRRGWAELLATPVLDEYEPRERALGRPTHSR